MHRDISLRIQCQQRSVAELQRFINQSMIRPVKDAGDNLDVVLAKAIQTKPFAAGIYSSIRADLLVTMRLSPFGYIGMKAFPVFHHGREQAQFTASAGLYS